jgi:hypothetical protein
MSMFLRRVWYGFYGLGPVIFVDKNFCAYLSECPVCLDVCKPPKQIMQCPEGHIMCKTCADNPQMKICPQCRYFSLYARQKLFGQGPDPDPHNTTLAQEKTNAFFCC